MRNNYLKWISHYREKGYRIYYQDETWVFKNMNWTKIWKGMAIDAMESEYRVTSGKGHRSLLHRLGNTESGLLENGLLFFRGSKSIKFSDYRTEFNCFVFSDC